MADPNMIPRIKMVRISLTLNETISTRNRITPAPIHAATTIAQLPRAEISGADPKPSSTRAIPKLAPELIPRTYGPAKGFLKMVCICNPLTESATPAIRAVITFGSLKSRTMVLKVSDEGFPPVSIEIISENGIFTDPKNKSVIKRITSITSNMNVSTIFLFFCLFNFR